MHTTKRRCVDPHDAEYSSLSGNPSFGHQQAQQQLFPALRSYDASNDNGPAGPSGHYLGSRSVVGHGTSAATAQFLSWDDSSYPDVATGSQQPYYYAPQTDPSIHNSPWPPAQSHLGTQSGSNYLMAGSNASIPYVGSSRDGALNADAGLDSNVDHALEDMQGFDQDIDMIGQYSYPQGSSETLQSRTVAPENPSTVVFDDASMALKNQSLPILDNLAMQLIQNIAKLTLPQIQEILSGSDVEESQAYCTLKSLFEQTRKVYSRDTPFIDAIAIQMFQSTQQEVIRKANIATFISSILGAHDVSFFHLNEFFMETFVPLGHRLLKWQGAIYLELKTQAYISALINSDGHPATMLDELFPPDLDAQILTRHPDAPNLSPSEQDFVDRSRARKSYLLAEGNAKSALKELPKKYQWSDFVREFAGCISKNVEAIMNMPVRAQITGPAGSTAQRGIGTRDGIPSLALLKKAADLTNVQVHRDVDTAPKKSSAATAATASAPSSTIRQPWTKPEEDALLAGLDRVNGPHWSQILALYGRGGSVSEVLKDRNQVQLKDKARNLKLWHLKLGRDVPRALQGVTGELRKRGGKSARLALGEEDADGEEKDLEQSGVDGGRRKKTKKGS